MTTKNNILDSNCNIQFRVYHLIEKAVGEGALSGYHKAHKYNDNPSIDDIIDQISHYVMLELSEIMIFNEDGEY